MENNLNEILKSAEDGSYESQHILALKYLRGDGVEKSISKSEYWFKRSSESKIDWMVNDYVDFMITNSDLNQDEIETMLEKPLSEGNSQSIRLYSKILLKSGNKELIIIGKNLLLDSYLLGNKWALNDLINTYKGEDDTNKLFKLCFNIPNPPEALLLFTFERILTDKQPNVNFLKRFEEIWPDNLQYYQKLIDLLMKHPKKEYASLININKLQSNSELKIRLAKLYRDGTIIDKDIVKYTKIIKTIPEELLSHL